MKLFSQSNQPESTPSKLGFGHITEKEYAIIRTVVYKHSRISLGEKKKELVMSRLAKRMRQLGLPSYRAYCDLISSSDGKSELTILVDAISTNHTYFFRESDHFTFLNNTALPQVCANTRRKTIRIWSSASSSAVPTSRA